MSKTYTLEIIFEENDTAIHEKTSEGITVHDARQIIAIFEQYKQQFLTYVTFSQGQTIDLKKQTTQ